MSISLEIVTFTFPSLLDFMSKEDVVFVGISFTLIFFLSSSFWLEIRGILI